MLLASQTNTFYNSMLTNWVSNLNGFGNLASTFDPATIPSELNESTKSSFELKQPSNSFISGQVVK